MAQYLGFQPTTVFAPLTEEEIQQRVQDDDAEMAGHINALLVPRLQQYTESLAAEMANHMDNHFQTMTHHVNTLAGQITALNALVINQQELVQSYKRQVDALPATAGGGHSRQPKIGEPPIFKGSDDKIKLEEWRNLISLWCAHEGIVTDKQKIVTALSRLQGPAHKYMESYYDRVGKNQDLGTWDNFVDELAQIYGQRDDKEGAKKEITALFNNKDLAAKDFIKYAERFRTLGRLTGYEDTLLIDKLREVISRDMRIALIGKGGKEVPTKWTAFLDMLLGFYKELNPEKACGTVFSKSTSDNGSAIPMDINVAEKSQNRNKKSKQAASATTDNDKKKFCHICKKTNHNTPDCYRLPENAEKRPKSKFQSTSNDQKSGSNGAQASKPFKAKKTRIVQIEVTDDEGDTTPPSASISTARIEEEDTDGKSVLIGEDELQLCLGQSAKGKATASKTSGFLMRHL
ncbi:hypothetical protein C2E23DRAFT_889073 [Lenzites betulinus]|nr:hypothetical protein C2E23DRAFT_889073 [Lenzites betulinus]